MSKPRLMPSMEKCDLGAGFVFIFQNLFRLSITAWYASPVSYQWLVCALLHYCRWNTGPECHYTHGQHCTPGVPSETKARGWQGQGLLGCINISKHTDPFQNRGQGRIWGKHSLESVPGPMEEGASRSSKPFACLYWPHRAFPPA